MAPFDVLTSNRSGLVVMILKIASLPYGLNTVRKARLLLVEKTSSFGVTNTGNCILEDSLSPKILLELLISVSGKIDFQSELAKGIILAVRCDKSMPPSFHLQRDNAKTPNLRRTFVFQKHSAPRIFHCS